MRPGMLYPLQRQCGVESPGLQTRGGNTVLVDKFLRNVENPSKYCCACQITSDVKVDGCSFMLHFHSRFIPNSSKLTRERPRSAKRLLIASLISSADEYFTGNPSSARR